MITGNQLEVLVALVLGLDAVVIAGIVISRLTHRRSNRQEAASSVAVAEPPYPERRLVDTSDSAAEITAVPATTEIGAPAATVAFAEAPPSVAEVAAVFSDAPFSGAPITDAPVADAPITDAPLADARAEYAAFAELAPPPVESNGSSVEELSLPPEALEALEAPGMPEVPEAPVPAPSPGPSPIGLDFGPTWVDPLEMAATAAAEWRHALRRDLARAAHRGRSGMVMHIKLDIEKRPDLSIQEVARLEGLLLETLNALIRSGDYVDRTGPGRFHMILSEMPEAGAVAVAERVKHVFAGDAPDGPRLLIGWAAMETEADIALALQRAAERIDDGRSDSGEGPLGR
jgi:GGDEF domain-containing protein